MMDAGQSGARRWERRPVRWPAKWRQTTAHYNGEVLDMSEGGAFLRASVDPQVERGEALKLTIDVPGRHPVTTTAVIRWSGYSESHASYGIGVEFEHRAPVLGKWADRELEETAREMGPPPKLMDLRISPYSPEEDDDD